MAVGKSSVQLLKILHHLLKVSNHPVQTPASGRCSIPKGGRMVPSTNAIVASHQRIRSAAGPSRGQSMDATSMDACKQA